MPTIVKIIAALIFIIVAVFITINITKIIFQKVAGDITEDIANNLTADIAKSITGKSSQKIDKKPCTLPKHEREFKAEPYYEGSLIDSHIHLPTSSTIVSSIAKQNGLELPVMEGKLSADKLVCLFDSEGIKQIFGFHIAPKFAEESAVSTAKAIEEAYPGKVAHFLMPPPVKSLNVESSQVKGILDQNQGLFKGFGEVALYMDGYEGTKPNDPDLKEIYKMADQHHLIVMIHPEDNLRDGVEEILQEFPNVIFFFHGGKDQEWIIDLMDKYKNFYYSIDANVTSLYGYKEEHKYQKIKDKEEYLSYIRENFNSQLQKEVAYWKQKIETHPDRFTWGTDRWFAWQFDPEVGGVLEEFGRSFTGKLDPEVQENFAYKNAEKMLEERLK